MDKLRLTSFLLSRLCFFQQIQGQNIYQNALKVLLIFALIILDFILELKEEIYERFHRVGETHYFFEILS